jgi:hypothetical protein
MAIWKLAEHGPVSITVTEITEQEGKFGPQFAVDGVTADGEGARLFVSTKALVQQLGRLKLDVDTALGQQLYFEQVSKDGTKYTNISRGTGGPAKAAAPAGAKAAAPAAAAAPARSARMTPAEAAKVYEECVNWAIATLGARLEQAEIPLDGAVIQSAAATLFIACK